ncbi:DUF2057 domain-containing protein [Neiella sp. HB171785]|uniref:DUF2057 domain-containing protein n=1 Tax=Neiella litorisoli TaxID=2771431 RepID=A0A8J6QFI2_9GAMM|nr:DUF2057 family protein [Neiella litorisoli]MBD1388415.1 DUF2057 domain-containing protein [Neiella litorisoli]
MTLFSRLSTVFIGWFCLHATCFAASLAVPEHLQIVTLNGEKQTWYLLMDNENYPLNEGINTITVRYRDLLESDYDDTHQTVTSEPVSLTFHAESQGQYQLTAERPQNESAAVAFAKKPTIKVATVSGQNVALLKPVYAPRAAAPTTATDHVSATPIAAAPNNAAAAANSASSTTAGQMLRYWWQQADPATRQAFLSEVSEQAK